MEKEEIKLFVDSKAVKEKDFYTKIKKEIRKLNKMMDAMDSIENAIQISQKDRNEWTTDDYLTIIKHIEKYEVNQYLMKDGMEEEWKELLKKLKEEVCLK